MPRSWGSVRASRAGVVAFRRSFWQPPRAHGDTIEGREVSFLELFYDLVYVVVVSQAAGHLAGEPTWAGLGRFAVVFGLVWLAWVNGAVLHDLHGRADGRTRFYVFAQMALLVLVAVFTRRATGDDGPPFAIAYSAFLFLLGWLWYTVRRQDDAVFRAVSAPYLVGVLGSAVVVAGSALLPAGVRLAVWGLVVAGWLVGITVLDWRNGATRDTSLNASESMVERFDLFTIIVLGEVVVGVVEGIADAGRSAVAVATGVLGLGIGFAYWWSYFDFVGRRGVSHHRGALSRWLVGHLPITMTIAATGAVMVGMVEHGADGHPPGAAAMLLSTSVATGLLALVVVATAVGDWEQLPEVYRPVAGLLVAAAVVALLLGRVAPPPWLQIVLLTVLLGLVWLFGMVTWFSLTRTEPTGPTGPAEPVAR